MPDEAFERECEAEVGAAMARRDHLLGRPFGWRLLILSGVAAMVLVPSALFLWVVARRTGDDVVLWVIFATMSALALVGVIVFAMRPGVVITKSVRSTMSYPTNAPGYRSRREP